LFASPSSRPLYVFLTCGAILGYCVPQYFVVFVLVKSFATLN